MLGVGLIIVFHNVPTRIVGRWLFSSATELPLLSSCGVVWDAPSRQAVVGICEYERLQVYGPDGLFRLGWFGPPNSGAFRIFGGRGKVYLFSPRSEEVLVYDLVGGIVDRFPRPDGATAVAVAAEARPGIPHAQLEGIRALGLGGRSVVVQGQTVLDVEEKRWLGIFSPLSGCGMMVAGALTRLVAPRFGRATAPANRRRVRNHHD